MTPPRLVREYGWWSTCAAPGLLRCWWGAVLRGLLPVGLPSRRVGAGGGRQVGRGRLLRGFQVDAEVVRDGLCGTGGVGERLGVGEAAGLDPLDLLGDVLDGESASLSICTAVSSDSTPPVTPAETTSRTPLRSVGVYGPKAIRASWTVVPIQSGCCPARNRRWVNFSSSRYLWSRARRMNATSESSGPSASSRAYPEGYFAGSAVPIVTAGRRALLAARSWSSFVRSRSSRSCGEVSRVSMRPPSPSENARPGPTT